MNNYRSSGRGRSSGYGGHSRFPRNNKRTRYTWSASDLVRSVEHAQRAKTETVEETYMPQNTFADLPIDPKLKKNIVDKGYKEMTPIQDKSMPQIIEGKDLIGIANTGTGKTAAFLIPLINKVHSDKTQKVLIIAPTRELAEQIDNEFRALSKGMGIYSALVIGGRGMRAQIISLQKRPNFIIGTPGRINDHVTRRTLVLGQFNNVVLDETDRMVDIGFLKEIKSFIEQLPQNRQSLFFSATVSSKVQEILQTFVKEPVTVSVKKRETSDNIKQEVIRVTRDQKKVDKLHDLLITAEFEKVLVFGNTKWGVQKLADELIKRGFKADAIHGDKRQGQRRMTLEKFKRNEIKILLATDVASRGLDIKGVSHVINYELPTTYDEYVHRIGRTGRANAKGSAITLIEEY